jgi:hypothetical protein
VLMANGWFPIPRDSGVPGKPGFGLLGWDSGAYARFRRSKVALPGTLLFPMLNRIYRGTPAVASWTVSARPGKTACSMWVRPGFPCRKRSLGIPAGVTIQLKSSATPARPIPIWLKAKLPGSSFLSWESFQAVRYRTCELPFVATGAGASTQLPARPRSCTIRLRG